MFFNSFKFYFIIIIACIIIVCLFAPVFSYYDLNTVTFYSPSLIENSISANSGFIWPIPTSTKISSYFGYRNSPTAGASSYHKGIDIAAPAGSNIYSVTSGNIINVGFLGSAGCCVIIRSNNYTISYCHIDPNFKVFIGQYVKQGELIAQVGPKNVYGFSNNKYFDATGNPTNGSTTGPHLHLTIKKDGIAVNPLNYLNYSSLS